MTELEATEQASETRTEVTPEQILKRIAELKTAGDAYRVIWAQVHEAEAALDRARRMASELQGELIEGFGYSDEFEQWLYLMSNQIDSRHSDIGFFDLRVSGMSSELRRRSRQLDQLIRERPDKAQSIARHVGLMEKPKKGDE